MCLKIRNTCKYRCSDPRLRVWKNLFLQGDCSIAARYSSYASPPAAPVPVTGRHSAGRSHLWMGRDSSVPQTTVIHILVWIPVACERWRARGRMCAWSRGRRWPAPAASAVPPCRVAALRAPCPRWRPTLAVLRGRSGHQGGDTSLSLCYLSCCKDQWGLSEWCFGVSRDPKDPGALDEASPPTA